MNAWRSGATVGLLALMGGAYTAWTRYRAYRDVERDHEETQARIEAAMPRDSGIAPIPQEPDLEGRLVMDLERRRASDDGVESVLVRVTGRAWTVPLPPDGQGDATEGAWIEEHWEPVIREIVEVLGRSTEESDEPILALRVPSPLSPEAVPPSFVIRMLSAAMEAGISDVQLLRHDTTADRR